MAIIPKYMTVQSVAPGSQADKRGIHPGDKVVGIDGGPARDFIDLMFYGDEDEVVLTIHRGTTEFKVMLRGHEDYGIEFEPAPSLVCGNRCVFCFVDQNPPGLRSALYLKDEDYRYSFLYGSYVTLTDLTNMDLTRIIQQRLSPLYVSVHATDAAIRMNLLGRTRPDNLMEKLERLTEAGIQLHTQVVVCPGINDREVLEKTVIDLRALSRKVLSVAVVPVGLTRHREGLFPLRQVDSEHARQTIDLVDHLHTTFRTETGEGFVYAADEWYIKAGLDIPPLEYYDEFPQIENGIGMVRQFLDDTSDLENRLREGSRRSGSFVLVTGTSMAPFVTRLAARLSAIPGIQARACAVVNEFYGDTVTVSGLLTGRDITRALETVQSGETVVLPPNCLNDDGLFLDNTTPDDIHRALGADVIQGDYDPVALFE